ncbi:MAG: hypothetical protein IJW55_07505 [Clostridia bacterium]|nr:hypothetical protein [Clostridia bacterium]
MENFITFVVPLVLTGLSLVMGFFEMKQLIGNQKKGFIKNKKFLKMSNSGPDLCKRGQKIEVKNYYCNSKNWISEV